MNVVGLQSANTVSLAYFRNLIAIIIMEFSDECLNLHCLCKANLVKPLYVSGLLGPPGSGVEWARHLIEQMTGMYTGSTNEDYPEYFTGEGKTNQVIIRSK